jgi:hypothetical protein
MKVRSDDSRKIDELDLAIEALKDLTPTATQADEVRGGMTGKGQNCYCGTM